MLFRLFDNWAAQKQEKDLDRFLLSLRGADGEELAGVMAVALEWSERLKDERGWDVYQPQFLVEQHPDAPLVLSKTIGLLQKQGNPHFASGLMVWAHTFRAAIRPQMRVAARAMWGELERSFVYVPELAAEFSGVTGMTFRIEELGRFPEGFNPRVK